MHCKAHLVITKSNLGFGESARSGRVPHEMQDRAILCSSPRFARSGTVFSYRASAMHYRAFNLRRRSVPSCPQFAASGVKWRFGQHDGFVRPAKNGHVIIATSLGKFALDEGQRQGFSHRIAVSA